MAELREPESEESVRDAYRRTAAEIVARIKAESYLRAAAEALEEIAHIDWRGAEPQSTRIALNALSRIEGWDR